MWHLDSVRYWQKPFRDNTNAYVVAKLEVQIEKNTDLLNTQVFTDSLNWDLQMSWTGFDRWLRSSIGSKANG